MGKEIRNFGDWMDAKKQDANQKSLDKKAAFSATALGQQTSQRLLSEQSGPVALAQRALEEHEAQYQEESPERQRLDAILCTTEQGRATVANRKEHYRKLKAAVAMEKGQTEHDAINPFEDAELAEQKRRNEIKAQISGYYN